MEILKIGNWSITEDGIEWIGQNEYFIEKDRLLENAGGERTNMYDWLVHLPTKSWLTEADIFALNSAFIFAIEYFEMDLNTRSFVETLIEQQKELGYRNRHNR